MLKIFQDSDIFYIPKFLYLPLCELKEADSDNFSLSDFPFHQLASPTKNRYAADPLLEAALDDDTSDTLGDSIDDFNHARH